MFFQCEFDRGPHILFLAATYARVFKQIFVVELSCLGFIANEQVQISRCVIVCQIDLKFLEATRQLNVIATGEEKSQLSSCH